MKNISAPMTTIRKKQKAALASIIASALVLFPTSWAFALTVSPTMRVTIGGSSATLVGEQWDQNAVQDRFTLARPVTARVTNLGSILIKQTYVIPDPVLSFSASATNQAANPLAHSVALSTPLAPNLPGLVNSHAELGVMMTEWSK